MPEIAGHASALAKAKSKAKKEPRISPAKESNELGTFVLGAEGLSIKTIPFSAWQRSTANLAAVMRRAKNARI